MTLIDTLPERLYADAVALWHSTALTRPWNDAAADLSRAISGGTSTVLAATDSDGALLGTAMVGHDGHRGWVYYLAVQPASQGHGIGRDLMRACERWVSERGIPKIQLMVRSTNDAVIGFYASLGYADADCVVLGRFLEH